MSEVIVETFDFAKDGGEEGIKKAITETLLRVHAQTVSAVGSDTGALANSYMVVTPWDGEREFNSQPGENAPSESKLTFKPVGLEGGVGSNMNYAVYHEFGTRAHKITVKNAKVLTDGKTFFGKSVEHPGTVANPALRVAGMAVRGATAQQIGEKYGREAMEEEFRQRKKKIQRLKS